MTSRRPGPTRVLREALLGAGVGWVVGGPTVGAVGAAAIVLARRVAASHSAGRVAAAREAELAGLLELAARGSRAGLALPQALADVTGSSAGPAAALLDELVVASRAAPLSVACRDWVGRHPEGGLPLVGCALGLAAAGAGSPARALDAAARALHGRQAAVAEIEAWSTQARASAVMLACTPLAFALVGLASGSARPAALLSAPAAGASIVAGLALEGVGAWWMLRIVRRAAAW